MFARTSTWSGSGEALERWVEHVVGQVQPFVAALPGNAGGMFLIDREGGRALTLTLWESEEAALETDRNSERSRQSTVEATGVELLERGRYEATPDRDVHRSRKSLADDSYASSPSSYQIVPFACRPSGLEPSVESTLAGRG
jgi:hypothetical protein